MKRLLSILSVCALLPAADLQNDVQLRAITDELQRAKTLHLAGVEDPYFIQYSIGDAEQMTISASVGGLIASSYTRARHPRVDIRTGSYRFDNSNSVYWRPTQLGLAPIDDDYLVIRRQLWLDSDRLFKMSADELARKRAAIRDLSDPGNDPDLSPAPPLQILLPASHLDDVRKEWESRIRKTSAVFTQYPSITGSYASLIGVSETYRMTNSEGALIREPQDMAQLRIRAEALTADGGHVWDTADFSVQQLAQLPPEAALTAAALQVASNVDKLKSAPLMTPYNGPVLFEQEAAAQLMAEILADATRLSRRPVAPPGANVPAMLDSVWASRAQTKVAPEWLTLIDDPTQTAFDNHPLAGSYAADDEGVRAQKTVLVQDGVLKTFLLSREPHTGFTTSNGHGRLAGRYGGEAAIIGNLFVQAAHPTPEAHMRAKLIEQVKAANLPFGIVVKRLDFPATAPIEELQDIYREAQKNGYARTVSAPLVAYRVYPDGKEELVRGVRFQEFSAKNLRDLEAASDKPYVLNYINYGAAFDYQVGSDAAASSVICPSLLFSGVDLTHASTTLRKPPVVPPPALTAVSAH